MAADGDIEARDHLILCLARNVGKIAGCMVTHRFPMLNGDGWLEAVHEIIGCGNLGLIDAPSKITLSRGSRLSTVAHQWIRKYAHDGLASLVSVIHYPERKRTLAKFTSQLVVSDGDGDNFDAFDAVGNPTNPDLKLGYLQRQVGKRLYPWHDWGDDWQLLGVNGRFEVRGGVTLDVQAERPSRPLPSGCYDLDPRPAFLNEWVRFLLEGQTYFGKQDPVDLQADICLLDNRHGTYCSKQPYTKPRVIEPEVVSLVEHVCTEMRYARENWHDAVPKRRQLDAYRDYDECGNRVDKVTLVSVPRHPIDYAAHTADGKPPNNWNTDQHWRTTYPIALDYQRRFTSREHDYFALLYGKFGLPPKPYPKSQPTNCRAPKKKDSPMSNIYAHCLYLARQARNSTKENQHATRSADWWTWADRAWQRCGLGYA